MSLKTEGGVCQMSVPPDWNVNAHVPSMATGPDLADAMILSQPGKTVRPMNGVVKNVVGVDKMLENTAQRVFWAAKPARFPQALPRSLPITWRCRAKRGRCAGQITIKQGEPEPLVRQIAATVAAVK